MNEKKTKKRSSFRRAASGNMSRDQAMLKNQKKRMAILKRRRRMLSLGLVAAALCLVLVVMSFMGYFDKKATESTLTVKNDGSITFEEIDEAEGETSKKEVVSYVKEAIEDYNAKTGETAVHFRSCDVADGQIYLKTIYKDAATYADFTGLSLFAGSVKEAEDAGYLFNETFVTVKDGEKKKQVKKAEVKQSGDQVLIIDQPVCVVLPTEVHYVSRDDTELISPTNVRIENAVESYIIYE